jgi:hypothetical protein
LCPRRIRANIQISEENDDEDQVLAANVKKMKERREVGPKKDKIPRYKNVV